MGLPPIPRLEGAAKWHESLRYDSDTIEPVDDFRNWGFTIYRTACGPPSTEEQWQQLLEKIKAQAYARDSKTV